MIDKNIYLVYGITDCPSCLMAQAALMHADCEYVVIEMDFSRTYREAMKEEFSWSTFPIIVRVSTNGEELVGGYEELVCEMATIATAPT